mmetsp:Transcript_699/g.1308  ORF Transcript_699/g.1308 Transcript_699/m.1308 type:complete len:338 (+) Transcript_699:48-1061(+)|eukprot:CAMPEP_0175091686 /NCGR_PEP_ID=MMETSP0086_2-20121207/2040_1 /TAXON_ID=136419 /ORGANISM="Unknown Unknown, Strain D1" /LENGTH=337 /DNA_ID=CAMNT_0016364455 /DNA_START=46 /DNA_END=1059 /DNA_ORIENTATION=-
MKFIASVLFAAMAATASPNATDWQGIADQVNGANTTWVAGPTDRFGSLEDVKQVCGTWVRGHPNYLPSTAEVVTDIASDIPSSFDARSNWPKCTVISKVRDQSACGSCWAFGSTEAFEASRCIAGHGDVEFSTEDTAGCCKGFSCGLSMGCGGGQPSAALAWMTKTGVVTGGDYADLSSATGGCKPYSLKPCAHHVPPSSKYPACPSQEYSLSCKKDCTDTASGKTYTTDKTKGVSAFSPRGVEAMQTAIMTSGPLAVAFTVYSDFPTYKSGVYKHTSGQPLGGHAVEMVGWGTENGEDYWIIKNSWNEQWGDNGYFKIARGTDECGIENDVTGIRF